MARLGCVLIASLKRKFCFLNDHVFNDSLTHINVAEFSITSLMQFTCCCLFIFWAVLWKLQSFMCSYISLQWWWQMTAWCVKCGIKRRFWLTAVSHMLVWSVPIALTAFSITAVFAAINVWHSKPGSHVFIHQFYEEKYSTFSCFCEFLWGYLHGSFMAFSFWKDQK